MSCGCGGNDGEGDVMALMTVNGARQSLAGEYGANLPEVLIEATPDKTPWWLWLLLGFAACKALKLC